MHSAASKKRWNFHPSFFWGPPFFWGCFGVNPPFFKDGGGPRGPKKRGTHPPFLFFYGLRLQGRLRKMWKRQKKPNLTRNFCRAAWHRRWSDNAREREREKKRERFRVGSMEPTQPKSGSTLKAARKITPFVLQVSIFAAKALTGHCVRGVPSWNLAQTPPRGTKNETEHVKQFWGTWGFGDSDSNGTSCMSWDHTHSKGSDAVWPKRHAPIPPPQGACIFQ